MSIIVMKQALEALETSGDSYPALERKAIASLRQAITEAEKRGVSKTHEWVGLTEEDCNDLYCKYHDENGYAKIGYPDGWAYERAIESKLKAKNFRKERTHEHC